MSSAALLPDEIAGAELLPPEGGDAATAAPEADPAIPGHVARHVLRGTSALGLGIVIERGAGFLANILAARFAGAALFGTYALAISTANNISTYAAGGIGSTAARFSGKYTYGTAGYGALARALTVISVISAAAAVAGLCWGAGPIAALLHKPELTGLLRWASLSAAGIILLECARGFFVGQRRLAALVLLSCLVAAGMLSFVPLAAAHRQPVRMLVSQGLITLSAVLICLALARPLGLLPPPVPPDEPRPSGVLGEVWTFGGVQLAGLIGANLSGWWLTALVARADTTLIQMSFFTIASQLRNLVSLAPSLLTEGSYASLADPTGDQTRTPQQLMAVCTFAATAATLGIASLGILVVPVLVGHVYGAAYRGAGLAATMGLAVAVSHMGNAPAMARLSIVSIRAAGLINTAWAAMVATAATALMLHHGSAAEGMAIFFGAHTLSAALVLRVLARRDYLPSGMVSLFALGTLSMLTLLGLATARERHGRMLDSVLMLAVTLLSMGLLFALGRSRRWLPTADALRRITATLRKRLDGMRTHLLPQRSLYGRR